MTTKELHEGINGSGNTIWIVATVKDGIWMWQERFMNKKEAECWLKWA